MDTFNVIVGSIKSKEQFDRIFAALKPDYAAIDLCYDSKFSLLNTDFQNLCMHICERHNVKVIACLKDLMISDLCNFIRGYGFSAVALYGTYTTDYLLKLRANCADLKVFLVQDPRQCVFDTFCRIYEQYTDYFIASGEIGSKSFYKCDESLHKSVYKDRTICAMSEQAGIARLSTEGFSGAVIDVRQIDNQI